MSKITKLIKYRYFKYRELINKISIDYSDCEDLEAKVNKDIMIDSDILNQALFISFSKLFNIYFFENELTFINHLIAKNLLDNNKLELLITSYQKYKRKYNSSEWIKKILCII